MTTQSKQRKKDKKKKKRKERATHEDVPPARDESHGSGNGKEMAEGETSTKAMEEKPRENIMNANHSANPSISVIAHDEKGSEAYGEPGDSNNNNQKDGKNPSESTPSNKKKNKKKRKRQPDEKVQEHVNNVSNKQSEALNKNQEAPTQSSENNNVWSKSKKKRMRLLRAKQKKKENSATTAKGGIETQSNNVIQADEEGETASNPEACDMNTAVSQSTTKSKTASKLQEKYAARLTGSRFRILNEELYTTTSSTAFERFQSRPELFDQYHEGFRHQVESWPSNPVDVMYQWITKKYGNRDKKSKNNKPTVVADFGCGDAELARRLLEVKSNNNTDACPFKVHSFDLVAKSDLVTACDMANVPLKDKSVDVAIFCLALMGTNVTDFLLEAHRVLKQDGRVKIAEVRSRFETNQSSGNKDKTGQNGKARQNSNNNNDPLISFVEQLDKLGFKCQSTDRSNKMFVLMELKKNGNKPDRKVQVQIKPCIYKRR